MLDAATITELSKLDPVYRVLACLHACGVELRLSRPLQWYGRCPSHDDENGSFALGQADDGRALMYCNAGCTTGMIATSIGLPLALLNARGPKSKTVDHEARRNLEKLHTRDADLADDVVLLEQIMEIYGVPYWALQAYGVGRAARGQLSYPNFDNRGRPIGFSNQYLPHLRVWAPGPAKKMETGGKLGLSYPLAGISEPLVVVVEGAGTAVVTHTCGLDAVAMPSASFRPPAHWSGMFRDRDVVVLPDADHQGRAAARGWSTWALDGGARRSAVVDLLPGHERGEDVADLLRGEGREKTTRRLHDAIDSATFIRNERRRGRPASAISAAEKFLHQELDDGAWHRVRDLENRMPSNVSEKTMRRARKMLHVESRQQGREWHVRMKPP